MGAVVCQACGAKVKSGRLRCLRCGEILENAPAAVAPGAAAELPALYARHRGPLVLAGSVISLIVLLVVVARRPEVAQQRTIAPAPVVTATARPTSAPGRPDPGYLDARTGGAVAYKAGDYASALEYYKKAVSLNPNDGDALNNLGQVLARNGDPASAIPYLQKAVQLYPSVWAYRFNLAHAFGRVGNWSQAVEDYRRARALFPEDYVTHFNLGMALHKLGDEEAAVSEFRKGAELAPAEPSFHLSLGISYEQLAMKDEAVRSYERFLTLSPSSPEAEKVKARIEELRKPT